MADSPVCAFCHTAETRNVRVIHTPTGHYCEYHLPDGAASLSGDARARITGNFCESLEDPDEASRLNSAVVPNSIVLDGKRIGAISVHSITIEGDLTLKKCIFTKAFDLQKLSVTGEVRIEDCRFEEQVHLEGLKCSQGLYITGADFWGDAHLSESRIGGTLSIVNNCFKRYFGCRDSEFADYVWFLGNDFQGYYNSIGSKFEREAFTENNIFHRVCTFDRSSYLRAASFRGSTFHRAPTFYSTTFDEEILLDQTKFDDLKSDDAYGAYRVLRQHFMNTGRRRDEAMMYRLEQASLTRMSNFVDRCLGMIYETLSGYGTDISRILISFFIGAGLFVAIYVAIYKQWSLALLFYFEQLFSPFSVWDESAVVPKGISRIAWGILGSAQGLYFVLLTALFIFALSWKFKKE